MRRGKQSKLAEAGSMGKEMTARNEGCLRGLYRGESDREREEWRLETGGKPNSRRCTPGQEDRLLLSSFHSVSFTQSSCQPATDKFSFSFVPFNSVYVFVIPTKTFRVQVNYSKRGFEGKEVCRCVWNGRGLQETSAK